MLGRIFGKGFFLLKANKEKSVRRLIFTPYRVEEGLCIFQRRLSGFDPSIKKSILTNKHGQIHSMKIHIWIMLKHIPVKFLGVSQEIAVGIAKSLELTLQAILMNRDFVLP